MKTLLAILILAASALAQTTGTVTVASSVIATAGTLSCVGTATVGATTSTMQLRCMDGLVVLIDYPFIVIATGSTTYSISRGANTITWLLTKGNPIPDQWQVAANGISKSGTF